MTAEPATWTQRELDSIVEQRLASASRCSSAIAHDLGNLVFIGEVAASGGGEDHAHTQQSLLQHVRDLLTTLDVWRHLDREASHPVDFASWWREHGGLLRQFVRRGTSVTMSPNPPACTADCSLLTRLTAALLCAIDLQCPDLERIELRPRTADDENSVRIDFVVTPNPPAERIRVPSAVTSSINAATGSFALTVGSDDAIFSLRTSTHARSA